MIASPRPRVRVRNRRTIGRIEKCPFRTSLDPATLLAGGAGSARALSAVLSQGCARRVQLLLGENGLGRGIAAMADDLGVGPEAAERRLDLARAALGPAIEMDWYVVEYVGHWGPFEVAGRVDSNGPGGCRNRLRQSPIPSRESLIPGLYRSLFVRSRSSFGFGRSARYRSETR